MKKFFPTARKIFLILLLSFLSFLPGFLRPQIAKADCFMDLQLHVFGTGVTEEFLRGDNLTVKTGPNYRYALIYTITGCKSSLGASRYYRILTKNGVVLKEGPMNLSTSDIQNESIPLGTPAVGETIPYSLNLFESADNQVAAPPEFLQATFVADNTPTTPNGSYTPTNVKICDPSSTNLTSTSAKICWTTSTASNSDVTFAEVGGVNYTVHCTNYSLTAHSITLPRTNSCNTCLSAARTCTSTASTIPTQLKAATTYNVYASSSPNANTTPSSSNPTSFTTKNTDGTGGSTTGGNGTTPIGTKGNVNYDASSVSLYNPLSANSVPEFITRIIKVLLLLIAMVAVVMIIVGGFHMVASQGNPDAITKGKKTVIWAIIGLVVALMSFSIVAIVQNLIQTR